MNITKADVAMLGRRHENPAKGPGEILAVYVRGILVNTKNARLHRMADLRYTQGWRERVAQGLLEVGWRRGQYPPATPKAVAMACNVYWLMDSVDGLRVACAPIIDSLKQCGVIDDDRDASGHSFTFTQHIDRKHRGVTIRVALRTPQEPTP